MGEYAICIIRLGGMDAPDQYHAYFEGLKAGHPRQPDKTQYYRSRHALALRSICRVFYNLGLRPFPQMSLLNIPKGQDSVFYYRSCHFEQPLPIFVSRCEVGWTVCRFIAPGNSSHGAHRMIWDSPATSLARMSPVRHEKIRHVKQCCVSLFLLQWSRFINMYI